MSIVVDTLTKVCRYVDIHIYSAVASSVVARCRTYNMWTELLELNTSLDPEICPFLLRGIIDYNCL
jgi:hypothetical protein